MNNRTRSLKWNQLTAYTSLLLAAAFVLAACSGGPAPTTAPTAAATNAPAATEALPNTGGTSAVTAAVTPVPLTTEMAATASPSAMMTEGAGLPPNGPLAPTIPATVSPLATELQPGVTIAAGTEMPAATQMMGTAAVEPTINVAVDPTLGQILVDGQGMTLYIFTKDTPDKSNCTGACLKAWPPLLSQGSPVAGSGVDASLLGVAAMPDGTQIVTYNHMPLYYYAKDVKPGDVTGQGVGGVWWVLGPDGKPVMTSAPATTVPTTAP